MRLYLITNKVDGKQYVGITSRPLSARWAEHLSAARRRKGWALHVAIREHGPDAFTISEVCSEEDWHSLCEKECNLISSLGCMVPNGYNITTGGEGRPGFKVSDETKAKISAAHKGKILTVEHREKLSKVKTGKRMPPRSDSHRAKISAGLVRAHARRRAEK